MQSNFNKTLVLLRKNPKKWLVTGVAGFIGSNLLETLLLNGQQVIGLDNFATGHQRNLDEVKFLVGDNWLRFSFLNGDIRDLETCRTACFGVDYVLHQAALGSVPRSIHDPITTNTTNIDGFLNMLIAARDEQVKSFTYAASSSTYGDHPGLPKVEHLIGKPLSPYAVTKYVNELYADVFFKSYGFSATGLRYFNVFGRRQDPNGSYAAVIPKWISAMIKNQKVKINGDGNSSRDFCYVENAVQANLLAATAVEEVRNNVFNVAVGDMTDLNSLFEIIKASLKKNGIDYGLDAEYCAFRVGDVRHSQADIAKSRVLLGYEPAFRLREGIDEAMPWYVRFIKESEHGFKVA